MSGNCKSKIAERIESIFEALRPCPDNLKAHKEIESAVFALGNQIDENCPEGKDKEVALRKLEEVMMWANLSIARKPVKPKMGGETLSAYMEKKRTQGNGI
jgi:hypothetical protein